MTWLEWMLALLILVWAAVGGVLCFIIVENLRIKLDARRSRSQNEV